MKDAGTEHKDVGTEMSPLGSSTTSRCHTPLKNSSPARHNTPANRSGPLASAKSNSSNSTIDISHLQECHLAKLQFGTRYDSITSSWSSREEEEEEVSKSLRHFETGMHARKVFRILELLCGRKTNGIREEIRIQAWMNLQGAKAEAQSRKLEEKIQKMRSKLEEKLMKIWLLLVEKLRTGEQQPSKNILSKCKGQPSRRRRSCTKVTRICLATVHVVASPAITAPNEDFQKTDHL